LYKEAAIAILDSGSAAEMAANALYISGLDMKKLSMIGKDYLIMAQMRNYYHAHDGINGWGQSGTFGWPLWGSTALVALLYSIGLPKDSIIRFETAIKQGYFVLVVHSIPEDISRSIELLNIQGHTVEIYASKEMTAEFSLARA
jgi:hypothetical protein